MQAAQHHLSHPTKHLALEGITSSISLLNKHTLSEEQEKNLNGKAKVQ